MILTKQKTFDEYLTILGLMVKAGAMNIDQFRSSSVLTEMDLIESLQLSRIVFKDRMSRSNNGTPHVCFKGDDAIGYQHFFYSIEQEIKELININFGTGKTSGTGGYFITKFNTLIVERLVLIAKHAIPDVMTTIDYVLLKGIDRIEEVILTPIHVDDARCSMRVLQRFSRDRYANNKKPMDKNLRLKYISMYAKRMEIMV